MNEAYDLQQEMTEARADLNPEQQQFTELYANGLNGRHAYMRAYGVANVGTADTNSSRLLKNAKVQEYLAVLNRAAANESVMSITERKIRLSQIAKGLVVGSQPRQQVQAIDVLNKMDSVYTEHVSMDMNDARPLSDLSDDELKQLKDAALNGK